MSNQLSVVIPSYNGKALLQDVLPRLEKSWQATVVDDASTDDSVEMLRREFPAVQVVDRQVNGGFSKAVNDGIRATSGDFVVLLNNDVHVTPDFLDELMPLFADQSVFAVTPRIILPTMGNLDEGAKTGFWHHGMFYGSQRQGLTEVSPVLFATGCAAVYRRSMLEELGGFDEAYSPFYWEDADLGYRAWKRGWKTLYQPASTVYHMHATSISKLRTSNTDRIKMRNALFFVWRNIEDGDILLRHRLCLPGVLLKRALAGDLAALRGWKSAFARRKEALTARTEDSRYRVLSDREIFETIGVNVC